MKRSPVYREPVINGRVFERCCNTCYHVAIYHCWRGLCWCELEKRPKRQDDCCFRYVIGCIEYLKDEKDAVD